jgi:excinuclease ABC subunit C
MSENKMNILKNFITTCSKMPGVYKIFGEKNNILYIGKAKNLKARIKTYQNLASHSAKTLAMLSQMKHIEIVITKDEVDALLLESNLIKQFKPKYNILLKDNKSFPYICLDESSDFPRLYKYRGSKLKGRTYYGPVTSVRKLEESVSLIQKVFLLRSCRDSDFKNRTRPCILYQIKRCSAPCVGKINKTEYETLVDQVKAFLSGKSKDLQKPLLAQMKIASDAMDYEKAALYRDRIKALAFIQSQNQFANLDKLDNLDVICVLSSKDDPAYKAIQISFIRSGYNLGSKTYYMPDTDERDLDDALVRFLQEFYQNHTLPSNILSNRRFYDFGLLEKLFLKLYGKKLEISCPVRGKKLEVIKFVEANLENSLRVKTSSIKKHAVYFDILKKYFKLKKLDKIEVYDNSHTSGFESGGVVIACGRNGFIKSDYRKYSVKDKKPLQDDYFILKEVLLRRFESKMTIPDLIIIDGGKGQLSVAMKAIEESGAKIPLVISLAKGEKRNSGKEIIYTSENKDIYLESSDGMKQYLQILRDEAHRFAITSHKSKRNKAMFKTASKKD